MKHMKDPGLVLQEPSGSRFKRWSSEGLQRISTSLDHKSLPTGPLSPLEELKPGSNVDSTIISPSGGLEGEPGGEPAEVLPQTRRPAVDEDLLLSLEGTSCILDWTRDYRCPSSPIRRSQKVRPRSRTRRLHPSVWLFFL